MAKPAGLPEIKGSALWLFMGYTATNEPRYTGVFGYDQNGNEVDGSTMGGSTSVKAKPLTFDASKSTSIYGASDTVQPPTLQMIPQIKY